MARLRLAIEGSFVHFLYFVRIEASTRAGADAGGEIGFARWGYLIERAAQWEQGGSEVVLKARQLGFTWLAAAYALFTAQRPGSRVLVISKGQLEAYAFLDRVKFINERLPRELRKRVLVDNQGELRFAGGGQILALPSTKQAGRGFTATLVIVDEAAYHPWAADNYRAYRPTVADGGQLIIMSTANGATGFFPEQYHRAGAGVFVPWWARPDRDDVWLERERQLYIGMPDEFRAEYPATPEEAFVQLTGLVYPMFTPMRHIRVTDPCKWEDCLYRLAGYDLGGGDPTAVVVLGLYRRPSEGILRAHQFGEYYKRHGSPTVNELADYLIEWHDRAPFYSIEADKRDSMIEVTLRNVYNLPATSAMEERKEGLGLVATWLDHDWLTIAQSCYESINEFAAYRWATRVDVNTKDRYATTTAFDNHGDAMDARRKALMRAQLISLNERPPEQDIAYAAIL